jgi:hypothetical protein
MGIRAERNRTNPDLGVLSGRLLFAVQSELFASLAAKGFADIQHRHGAVLAYLDPEGVRATELSRLSGQHKQVVGSMVDELRASATSSATRIRPTGGPSWSARPRGDCGWCGRPTGSWPASSGGTPTGWGGRRSTSSRSC